MTHLSALGGITAADLQDRTGYDPAFLEVPIADTGVVLDQLVPVDRLRTTLTGAAPPPPGQASGGWVELRSPEDVALAG